MKRLLIALFAVAGALAVPRAAQAACGSIPYVFQNTSGVNSIVDATTTNANNQFLQACATQVDNTQIGPAGIFASQIVPNSTTTGTFGGGTSLYPFSFGLGTASQVPLSVQGYTGQTADVMDVWNTSARTSKWAWFDSTGAFHEAVSITSGGPVTVTAGNVALTGASSQEIQLTDSSGTPNKYLRASGGSFQVVNNANSGAILSVTDTAALNTGAITASSLAVGTGAVSGGAFSASSLTLTTPLSVANGGTGVSSISLNECVRTNGTPTFVSAVGDCVTSVSGTAPIASSGGTTPAISCPTCVTSVTASGNLASSGGTTPAITMTGSPSFSGTITSTQAAGGATPFLNYAAGGGGTATMYANTIVPGNLLSIGVVAAGTYWQLDKSGNTTQTGAAQASSNGVTVAHVPPFYTAGGSDQGATAHMVCGEAAITSNGTGAGAGTVTLSGAAAFASAASYFVNATALNNLGSTPIFINSKTATSFVINFAAAASTAYNVDYCAIGT